MALLFTIKVASERSWWGTGAQVSHSGELLLRDYSDVETKGGGGGRGGGGGGGGGGAPPPQQSGVGGI